MNKKNILLIFGFGYTSKFICQKFSRKNWQVYCTTRSGEKIKGIKSLNAIPIFFDDREKMESVLSEDLYILSTVPPDKGKDPVIENYGNLFKKNSKRIKWAGYLSTTSVYGDKKGEWVTEETVLEPMLERSISRVVAEKSWIEFAETLSVKTAIFRLAGIYGPGRSLIDRLIKNEEVYVVDKPGHLFNRIHIEDIVGVIEIAIRSQPKTTIFNLCDDFPATQLDVAKFAASLLKKTCPDTVSLKSDMISEMAKSFYKEEKKVSNKKIKDELGYQFTYPSFKEGLLAIYRRSKEF